METKKPTKKAVTKRQSQPKVPPQVDYHALRSLHLPHLLKASSAALRLMKSFMGAMVVRVSMSTSLASLATMIVENGKQLLLGKYVPDIRVYDQATLDFQCAVADTQHVRNVCQLVQEQIADLNEVYLQIQSVNGVVAFHCLRQASRGMFERDRTNWGHVLRFWNAINSSAVTIANWQPSLTEDEFSLRFDEQTKTWLGQHVPGMKAAIAAYAAAATP